MIITRTVAALSILAAVLVGCSSSSGSSGSSSSTPSATPTPYQTLTAAQLSTYRAHIRDLPCDSLAALQDEALSHRDQLAFEAIAAQEQARHCPPH